MRRRIIQLITAKELLDTLRDRRTLFVALVLPLLLYPALLLGLTQIVGVTQRNLEKERQRVWLDCEEGGDELAALYASEAEESTLARGKKVVTDGLAERYAELKQRWDGFDGFDRWFDRPVNNARLASVATYEEWVPAFLALAEAKGNGLSGFYQACKDLSDLPPRERHQQLMAWAPLNQ